MCIGLLHNRHLSPFSNLRCTIKSVKLLSHVNMDDEKSTLNYDCNYNLFLAKRLIRDVRKSHERDCAVQWLRYLMGSNKTIGEMQLRNDFLHYLVQNLQEGHLRPPFDSSPLTSVALTDIAHLIPGRDDDTMNVGDNSTDDDEEVGDDEDKPLVMKMSPDGGAFLALQPIPRDGSFCYLAITTRKQKK